MQLPWHHSWPAEQLAGPMPGVGGGEGPAGLFGATQAASISVTSNRLARADWAKRILASRQRMNTLWISSPIFPNRPTRGNSSCRLRGFFCGGQKANDAGRRLQLQAQAREGFRSGASPGLGRSFMQLGAPARRARTTAYWLSPSWSTSPVFGTCWGTPFLLCCGAAACLAAALSVTVSCGRAVTLGFCCTLPWFCGWVVFCDG